MTNLGMKNKENNIIIYQNKKGAIEFKGDFQRETIWATRMQIAEVFNVTPQNVTLHLKRIYTGGELDKKSTSKESLLVQTEGGRKIERQVDYYNLDVIISVGYRINSILGTAFRKWATKTLKDHLVKGYTINRQRLVQTTDRLEDLQGVVQFLNRKAKHKLLAGQEKEILSLLSDYSKTISLLEDFDAGEVAAARGIKGRYCLSYETAIKVIGAIKKELRGGELFGKELNQNLQAIIGNIYQSQRGTDIYPTLEEKAAHLLYFIVKDHPFVDGNKRIASFLFVYLLDRNDYLFKKNGECKINDNALTALTLLVATSSPREKLLLTRIISNLLIRM